MMNRDAMGKQVGAFGPASAKKKAKPFRPGGHKGKLHRELGIPVGTKIPPARLASAQNSNDPEVRRDAIRAKTMAGWKKGPSRGAF